MSYKKSLLISTLDDRALVVLWCTLYGFTVRKTADFMSLSTQGINYHLGKIYKLFNIQGNGRRKRGNLIGEFQRTFFDMLENGEININAWIRYHPNTIVEDEEAIGIYQDISEEYRKNFQEPDAPSNFSDDRFPPNPPEPDPLLDLTTS